MVDTTGIKTSKRHPIETTIIDDSLPGTVALTFAPGTSGTARSGEDPPEARPAPPRTADSSSASDAAGTGQRDVVTDLDVLVNEHAIGLLVCLLEDHELAQLGIEHLIDEAEQRMEVVRLPIPDRGVCSDVAAVKDIVHRIEDAAANGIDVVIHCRDGLGRAGTIGGCYLRQRGYDDDEIFAALRERHETSCPETAEQRAYIRAFPVEEHDDVVPAPLTMPSSPPRSTTAASSSATSATHLDRVQGAVLAAAIGDAIGHPTEFLSMAAIKQRWGDDGVTGFELWWDNADGTRCAPYTDDTQMSECVIDQLLDSDEQQHDVEQMMTALADRFVAWADDPQGGHRAPGNACLSGCRALSRGVHWSEAGGEAAGGCGSVMRAWPIGLRFCDDLDHAEFLAVEHSKLTHRDPIALAACAAVVRGIGLALSGSAPVDVGAAMVVAAAKHSAPTAAMIQRAVDEAIAGVGPEVTLDRLRAWAAHEAIAGAAYIFMRHPDDVRAGILEGANTPGDSDSLASIAGALIGARCGLSALPADWVRDVERSAVLLAKAKQLAR